MNTIQEEILNKFKKALSNEDLEKLKKKNSNITLKIGIVLIAIATIISILRVISNSLIDTNFYILSFWPLLLIGSSFIIANVWFKSDLNRITIQKNLIEKGFDVYNLSEENNFEYIQEFGNLLFKDIASFLHSDKELILTLREIFYYENELKILSASGLPKELSFYFRNEIKINNKPFYPELITKKKIDDDNDYFKILHEAILTQCSKQLKKTGLLELFEFEELNLVEKKIDDLGDKDYILNKILKELNVQFNTRKQLLLKTMYAYISCESELGTNSDFSLYGTNSFHVIWENVCAEVFNNMLNKKLSELSLPLKLKQEYNENHKLISIIEKPNWNNKHGEFESDTLIPDLISIYQDNNQEYKFIIFDAKYYTIKINGKSIIGQPGIESVTKQYLYQLAYKKFIEDHGFKQKNIRNCFLLPTENSEVEELGNVSMEMLTMLGLEKIQVRLLPADVIYGKYLKKTKFDINLLNL